MSTPSRRTAGVKRNKPEDHDATDRKSNEKSPGRKRKRLSKDDTPETKNNCPIETETPKKKDVVQEKKDVVQEKKDVVQEKKDAVQEKKDVVQEKKDVVQEKKDVVQEKNEVLQITEKRKRGRPPRLKEYEMDMSFKSTPQSSSEKRTPKPTNKFTPNESEEIPLSVSQGRRRGRPPRLDRQRVCQQCGKEFKTPAQLDRHLKVHSSEKPFSCPICWKSFKSKAGMEGHLVNHHGEGVSDAAQMADLQKQALANIKIEFGSSPEIPKYFSSGLVGVGAAELEAADIMAHTLALGLQGTVPPFDSNSDSNDSKNPVERRTCAICDKVCSKPTDLQRHLMKHTGERPFPCHFCKRGFKAKRSLQYHLKGAHGVDIELSPALQGKFAQSKTHRGPGFVPQDVSSSNEEDNDEVEKVSLKSKDVQETITKLPDSETITVEPDIPELKSGGNKEEELPEEGSSVPYLDKNSEDNVVTVSSGYRSLNERTTANRFRLLPRTEEIIATRVEAISIMTGEKQYLYRCLMCQGKLFSLIGKFQTHINTHKRTNGIYSCLRCGMNFTRRNAWAQHWRYRNCIPSPSDPQQQLACSLDEDETARDGDTEDNKVELEDEINKKEEGGPIIDNDENSCEEMPKIVSLVGDFAQKLPSIMPSQISSPVQSPTRCSSKLDYECRYCGKNFDRPFSLQRHERIHTGDKPCYCRECGRGFSEPRNLRHHIIRFHSDGSMRHLLRRPAILQRAEVSGESTIRNNRVSALKKSAVKLLNSVLAQEASKETCPDAKTDINQNDSEMASLAENGENVEEQTGPPNSDPLEENNEENDKESEEVLENGLETINGEHRPETQGPNQWPSNITVAALLAAKRGLGRGTGPRKRGRGWYFSSYSPRLGVVDKPVARWDACRPLQQLDGRTLYPCLYCGKSFCSASDLNRHMDFHEDIRPYKCDLCDYNSRTSSQLKVHMMRHQGIKQYLCNVCNYNGVTQSDLNRHCKTQAHIARTRNLCIVCGLGFYNSLLVEAHVSRCHSGASHYNDELSS